MLILLDPKLLVKEVIGWKWLQHENILPFIGVTLTPPLFSIVSERMENGNIVDFIKARPDHNRLRLVSSGGCHVYPTTILMFRIAYRYRDRVGIPTRSGYHPRRS